LRRVLYDCDVILDVLLARTPHEGKSTLALDAAGQGIVEGYVSGHAVTTLFYLLRKRIGSEPARVTLGKLLTRLKIAPVTDASIHAALTLPLTDFEDAVTCAAAQEAGIDLIVTRNLPDYAACSVQAVNPGRLLALIQAKTL